MKKLFHSFVALLMLVSVFVPLLKMNSVVNAAEKPSSEYTLTTVPTINTNKLVDHAKYGEGKFYLQTTYKFPDNVTLNNGDFVTYQVPAEFKIEQDSTTPLKAANGETIAELTTDKATNTAKITVTNEEYFKKFNENKELVASFTTVWADHVQRNKEYEITILGAGVYHLTRIVPDDDPTGFTKWGVQDSNDPNYVNWRVRINRYAENYTGVSIKDTIPEGQVLASEITGYYFPNWENGDGRSPLDKAHVQVTDKNHFTVTPNGDGTLPNKGLYLIYRTRLTKPVDPVTKRVLNHVTVPTNEKAEPFEVDGFAPITTTDGVGTGAKSDEVEFQVTKKLEGKTLAKDAFSFQLIDKTGQVVETVKNDENGKVKFTAIKFSEAGESVYTIKEVNDAKKGYTYDEKTITATVTVEDVYGEKIASVKYDSKEFSNSYKAAPTTVELKATKVLQNKTLEADKYTFELKENGQVVQTAKNAQDGSIKFPAITYATEGVHTYTVTEQAGTEDDGVTFDSNAYEVTVEVKDNGEGQLVATIKNGDNLTFTNVYSAKPVKKALTATKVLNGGTLADDQFEFELKEGQNVVATAKNKADGSVTFKEIEYTAAGKHTYTVSEKAGSATGYTYDSKVYTVTVDVVDNGKGQLVATVTDGDNLVFTNKYEEPTTTTTTTTTTTETTTEVPSTEATTTTVEEPKEPELPNTGATATLAGAGVAVLLSGFAVLGFKKREN